MLIEQSGLSISIKETTTQSELSTYVSAVRFMAFWLEKQDGTGDKSTEELLEEFKSNVCAVMKGEYEGTG